MKIKQWLLISYFLVMVLPLAVAYLLFAWIQSYNNEQKVEEYFAASIKLQSLNSILDDPQLYQPGVERTQVEELTSSELQIALYSQDGLVLYSSDPTATSMQYRLTKENLYRNLYSLEQGYRAYSYKQPVLSGGELVGFYEVQIAREQWTEGVAARSWVMIGIFIAVFLTIFIAVAYLVNQKLTKRLSQLMKQMMAFARQEEISELPAGKDEIGELTLHFYKMRREIEAARELIDREQREKEYMIASISHDLKTPLTSISAYAESLFSERDLTVSERDDYRQIIMDKVQYMKQMIDDLLMYNLLQSPRYDMELLEVEGGEFFEMLVSDYEPLCRKKNIELSVSSRVSGNYQVNPKQLMRVCDNLISNAISYTQTGGRIWIHVFSLEQTTSKGWMFDFVQETAQLNDEESVYLIVQNEGDGIPKDKIDYVFDPLYQVDQARSKTDSRGTGLGLSITKQIIEKHNGDIQIYSKSGVGTCVICRIPQKTKRNGDKVEDS